MGTCASMPNNIKNVNRKKRSIILELDRWMGFAHFIRKRPNHFFAKTQSYVTNSIYTSIYTLAHIYIYICCIYVCMKPQPLHVKPLVDALRANCGHKILSSLVWMEKCHQYDWICRACIGRRVFNWNLNPIKIQLYIFGFAYTLLVSVTLRHSRNNNTR